MNTRKKLLAIGIAAATLEVVSPYSLIATAQAEETEASKGVVEEVVVLARRRSESLQQTPISVVALNELAIEQQNLTDLKAFDIKFPNVAAGGSGGLGGSNAAFFIRGVGTDRNAVNQETAVALYVDDTYYGRTDGALLSVLDVQQVEVSRGPQGTLFGRSATGGAIRYITKKPDDDFGGKIQATLGSEGRRDLKAVLNTPISDTVAARFTAATLNQDGHVTNAFNGRDYGNTNSDLARGQLRWAASDTVEVLGTIDYTTISTNGAPSVLVGKDSSRLFFGDELLAQGLTDDDIIVGDFRTSYQNGRNFYDSDNYGGNLTVKWEASDELSFQSSTSIREIDVAGAYDADATQLVLFEQIFDRDIEMFSQEFQFSGGTDTIDWIAGLFYYNEEASDIRDVLTTASGGGPNRSSTRIVNPYTVDSYALFGQATFDLSDRWSLTTGLRYTYDDKSISANELRANGDPRLPENVDRSNSWNNLSGRISVDFQATDDVFLFGSYARGFRSGGFNDRIRTDTGAENFFGITTFDEEILDMCEFGVRSDLLDNRLRINATAFFGKYSDMQISSLLPGTTRNVIQNIGESKIRGLETEIVFAASDIVTIDASFGYLSAQYSELNLPVGVVASVTTDSDFGRAPNLSYSLGMTANWEDFVARIDYGWKDDFRSVIPDANFVQQDSYGLLSANFSYSPADADWKVSLFGTNLTDEEYLVSGLDLGGLQPRAPHGIAQIEPGRFREFGLKVDWEF